MASSPPFGLVIPSRPVLINPAVISPTQFAFSFPSAPAFTHITVFLLPGTVVPEGTLASIYVQLPNTTSGFRLLGAIGNEKQSALFKVSADGTSTAGAGTDSGPRSGDNVVEDELPDVDAVPGSTVVEDVTLGISIEPAATVAAQLETLKTSQSSSSTALVVSRSQQQPSPVSTKILAQRIIQNAFNFLASFAGSTGAGGQEVIPLRSFQDWWSKFERRIENDPGFLERENEN